MPAPPQGTIWSADFHRAGAPTIGDIQRELPKPETLKDVVHYKGPTKESTVLKQANTNSELEKAVRSGDSERVAAILRFGLTKRCVNVNAPLHPRRDRVLHHAARGNHRDICVMLLEARAELDCEEISDGRHPLHDAALSGSYDVVELLLDRKARIEECTFRSMRPLHYAAEAGHTDVVDLLLDRQAKANAAAGDQLQPLHLAARGGHADTVRLLCSRGAKVDAEANGRRPLQVACLAGHLRAAAVLVDFGSLGVLGEFNPGGLLAKHRGSELEEFLRAAEQLRFQRDEAEELSDMGQQEEASELFRSVVSGYLARGLERTARSAHEDALRCGVELEPLAK